MTLTMLYKPGSMLRVWHKHDVDFIKVPTAEIEEHLNQGWFLRPGDWEKGDEPEAVVAAAGSGNLLDNPANVIIPALAGLPLEELEALLAAEEAGKTRKGIVRAIQAEIDKRLAE